MMANKSSLISRVISRANYYLKRKRQYPLNDREQAIVRAMIKEIKEEYDSNS